MRKFTAVLIALLVATTMATNVEAEKCFNQCITNAPSVAANSLEVQLQIKAICSKKCNFSNETVGLELRKTKYGFKISKDSQEKALGGLNTILIASKITKPSLRKNLGFLISLVKVAASAIAKKVISKKAEKKLGIISTIVKVAASTVAKKFISNQIQKKLGLKGPLPLPKTAEQLIKLTNRTKNLGFFITLVRGVISSFSMKTEKHLGLKIPLPKTAEQLIKLTNRTKNLGFLISLVKVAASAIAKKVASKNVTSQ